MKKRYYLILLLIAPLFFYGQSKTMTLQQCVEMALEKNISIKQSILELESAAIDKQDAKGNFLPRFNAQSSHSWNIGLNQNITTGLIENLTTQFSSIGVNMGVNLYNGGVNFNRLYRANLTLLARQYQLEDMTDDIKLFVANAYLQIMFNREIFQVQKLQLEITKKELERTQSLIEAGVIPAGNIFEVEANLASQEQALIQAENAYRISKISLAQALLITDYNSFDIAKEEFDVPVSFILQKTPKEIYKKSIDLRNDIKLAETNIEIAKNDIEIVRKGLLPTLSGFYSYSTRVSYSDRLAATGTFTQVPVGVVQSTGESVVTSVPDRKVIGPASFADQLGLNDGHNFGLQLSIPIFNGNAVRNNIKRSKINLSRSENLFEQEKLNLESTINQSFNDAIGADKVYEASQKTVLARKNVYENAENRYKAGVMNSFDFIQSKQRYEASVSDLIRSKYDYIFKLKVLEFYFGIPIQLAQ